MGSLLASLESYLSEADITEIRRAFQFGQDAHAGQLRLSGEPYIGHPVAVASILKEMRMDGPSLCAAILHDVIEDTDITSAQLAAEFGEEVAHLVDGVTKLTQVRFPTREDAQAAYFRKMFLAMADDLRVVLIKLADRLHNMRTCDSLPVDKRKRIARETLDVYAPIAARLGLHEFRVELEEIGFAALYPLRHRVLSESLRRRAGNRAQIIEKIEAAICQQLGQEQVPFRLVAREKHVYSVYLKMKLNRLSFQDIYDVYGLRVIVDSVDNCYRTLGIVHNVYKPIPDKFKDYIAIPKVNGYQSLHTTLFTHFGVPVEIQIRTEEMDQVANAGIAAHWLYKAGTSESGHSRTQQQRAREWLNDMLDLQKTAGDSREFLDSVKVDLFPDEVYVFTPKGDILELPAGATAVDFAYAVHTQVGNQCVAVRIDRNLAPLSSRLESGSTVEVITAPAAEPNPQWLNFVVTGKARSEIRNVLKQANRGKAIEMGRRLLERQLDAMQIKLENLDPGQLERALGEFKVDTLDDLYEQIGLGDRMALVVSRRLVQRDDAERSNRGLRRALSRYTPGWLRSDERRTTPLAIKGSEGVVVSYARCCRPIPGDRIRGFATAGHGMVVHVDNCPNTADYRNHPDRWIDVDWDAEIDRQFPVDIRVEVVNQRGVLAVLATAIAEMGSNIDNVNIEDRDGYHSVSHFTLQVDDRIHLARLMRKLRTIKQVVRISRKRG